MSDDVQEPEDSFRSTSSSTATERCFRGGAGADAEDSFRGDSAQDEIDDRKVFLSPAAGPWYSSDPGRWHTSRTCAGRGIRRWTSQDGRKDADDLELVREVYLERAVKEGFIECGTCAKDVEHDFEPADYPPGTLAQFRHRHAVRGGGA